jgi:hypothetical protein
MCNVFGSAVVAEESVVMRSWVVGLLWDTGGYGDRRCEGWMSKGKSKTVFENTAVGDELETVVTFDGIVQISLELLTRHG